MEKITDFEEPIIEEQIFADDERVAALEAELDQMRDRWMRAEAELAKVRARAKREVDETRLYAVQQFAGDVVEAADNLRRGLDSLPSQSGVEAQNIALLRDGIGGIERGFIDVLERNGIVRQDPTGLPFDPHFHQAMTEQVSTDQPPGTVLQAMTPVWTLNGRLLRAAMVVVAARPRRGEPG